MPRELIKYLLTSIAEEDFESFYPDETIYRLSFSLRLTSWERALDFGVIRKLVGHEDNNQRMLFSTWHYQLICHN
jgi:hypothetical protein